MNNYKSGTLTGFEIAIIGMSGRFPGAENIRELWDNLKNSVESISFFSDRELEEYNIEPDVVRDPNYVKAKGILSDIEYFDASFFGYTPGEAEKMDPQMRFFMECAWSALEDAGYDPGQYHRLIGIYAGATPNSYWETLPWALNETEISQQLEASVLNNKDFLSAAVSYKFNLEGPGFTLFTACSTSLVAIHLACQGLLSGECDMALAGGVSIKLPKKHGYIYQEGMLASPDGHCRAFDSQAGGTVYGDGVAIVVLKRLQEALADGDTIDALVKGSAVNNDGRRKVGFTALSVKAQVEVVKTAMQMAIVEPESIGYLETQGTATALGDTIEIEALNQAFDTNKRGFCPIGSLKSNIGHLDCAAGAAGFIKTVLAIKHRLIPPMLHFEKSNPEIDFENSPFYVNRELMEWKNNHYPLRAGVSAFGIGGTNAHVVLEEWPDSPSANAWSMEHGARGREYQLILLSARTESALERMAQNLADHLEKNPHINLADTAYTLQVGRRAFKYRMMCECANVEEAIEALSSPGSAKVQKSVAAGDKKTDPVIADLENLSLNDIGRLWLDRHTVDWQKLHFNEKRHRIPLPTYPFEKQRYWQKADAAMFLKKADIEEWFYVPYWYETRPPCNYAGNNPGQSRWLVFIDEYGVGSQLVEGLKQDGMEVISVRIGTGFVKLSVDQYALNPSQENHYEALLVELQETGMMPTRIIHLWSAAVPTGEGLVLETIDRSQDLGYHSLIRMVRGIERQGIKNEIAIVVITNNVQNITGGDVLFPEKAAVLGSMQVIPMEYPNIKCRNVDVDLLLSPKGSMRRNQLIRDLLKEIKTDVVVPVSAYRGNRRWEQSFKSAALDVHGTSRQRLKENGVYLLSGELQGIGLDAADSFIRALGAKVALVESLDFPSPDQWDQVKELKERGAELLVLSADTANLEEMRKVIREVHQRLGKINGVIYSSMAPKKTMNREESQEIPVKDLAAEVKSVFVLDTLLKDTDLDFFILCSSLTSGLGPPGRLKYCGFTAFLNAFAHYKASRQDTFCVSINWDEWQFESIHDEDGTAILPREGRTAFIRILDDSLPQVMVSTRDFMTIYNRMMASRAKSREAPGDVKAQEALHPRPEVSTEYAAPTNEIERKLVYIWQQFFKIQPIGVCDNFFELGGDSLKAISVIARIHKELNVEIPIVKFFDHPTIKELAQYINQADTSTYSSIEPGEEKEYYPLSSAQQRFYMVQQLEPGMTAYNLVLIKEIGEQIDKEGFENAFRELIHRHEILRTSFPVINGEVVQRIHKQVDFSIRCPGPPGPGSVGITANDVKYFDLSRAPLMRLKVIKAEEKGYILVCDIHHIITDGISIDIFMNELMEIYAGKELPPFKLQYRDFCQWQNHMLASGKLKKQEKYWLEEFSGKLPVLNMPTNYQRPPVQSFEGDIITFHLDRELTRKLNKLMKETGTTLFMMLLALYNILLSKYTGQDDIIIGTTTAGRNQVELGYIIGLFIETLATRNYPGDEKTFEEFLEEVKTNTLNAFENQAYPFRELVKHVWNENDISRNPLFDAMLIVQNFMTDEVDPGITDLRAIPYEGAEGKMSKVDISLEARETENGISFFLEYCTKLFEKETMEYLINFFKKIALSVVDNKKIKLKDIRMSYDFREAIPGVYDEYESEFEF